MKHYGDITKINGAEAPVVDIITGGSPCQDLSVAGKRAGLAGERSGLFMEQIRLVKEMREFVKRYVKDGMVVIDPFANDSKYGTITNDMNPEFDTDYHMDALEFLKMLPDNSADVVLYDPPYSFRQVSECYKSVGKEVTMETTQSSWRSRHLDEIARITKNGGVCLSFGWNSNGVGKKRGFEQVEILLVAHGGMHNDTICVAEVKRG